MGEAAMLDVDDRGKAIPTVHSLLDILIEHFEEMKRSKESWSSNGTPTSSSSSTSTISTHETSSPGKHPPRTLITMEEALMETKLKGNLLSRIERLEKNVLKMEQEMKMKKKVKKKMDLLLKRNSKKKLHGINPRKSHSVLVSPSGKDQQLSKQSCPPRLDDVGDYREDVEKAKKMTLLQRVLQRNKPLAGFNNFVWRACKGTPLDHKPPPPRPQPSSPTTRHKNVKIKRKEEEDAVKKAVLPMVNMTKLKSLDGVEVSKLLSLQGLQSQMDYMHGSKMGL